MPDVKWIHFDHQVMRSVLALLVLDLIFLPGQSLAQLDQQYRRESRTKEYDAQICQRMRDAYSHFIRRNHQRHITYMVPDGKYYFTLSSPNNYGIDPRPISANPNISGAGSRDEYIRRSMEASAAGAGRDYVRDIARGNRSTYPATTYTNTRSREPRQIDFASGECSKSLKKYFHGLEPSHEVKIEKENGCDIFVRYDQYRGLGQKRIEKGNVSRTVLGIDVDCWSDDWHGNTGKMR